MASIVTESARRFPQEAALIQDGKIWTYRDLKSQVLSFATYLKSRGIVQGDRIALMCGNRPEFTISYFGILAAGATIVSLNNRLVADEVTYQLDHSTAVGAIGDGESLPILLEAMSRLETRHWILQAAFDPTERIERSEHIPVLGEVINEQSSAPGFISTRPDDTAVVMYTSGTTGHPKGTELTHFNLWENARICSERVFARNEYDLCPLGPGHVAMAALPLFHSFGQTCVQNALLFNGGAITYLRRFDPMKMVRIIARDHVTVLNAVPTIFSALVHSKGLDPALLKTLQYGISGGAALPLDTRRAFKEKFGVTIQEGYGLTETSPVASVQRQWLPCKTGSIGRPITGVEMKIFDSNNQEVAPGVEGEVVIRGHNVMKGYLKNPEATAQAMRSGWFHSGDIGHMDLDGDFFIVDRKRDLIIRGGFNVYPREVEEVLYNHPDIIEASVIGIPDYHYGEEVKAVVALRNGTQTTAQQIITYCKAHVAAYKYPRIIEFVAELPKGSTGKILKREIKRMYAEKREEEEN